MMARVRGGSPARLARTIASTMGTKKQSDLPEPVPVVTTNSLDSVPLQLRALDGGGV